MHTTLYKIITFSRLKITKITKAIPIPGLRIGIGIGFWPGLRIGIGIGFWPKKASTRNRNRFRGIGLETLMYTYLYTYYYVLPCAFVQGRRVAENLHYADEDHRKGGPGVSPPENFRFPTFFILDYSPKFRSFLIFLRLTMQQN